MENKESLREMVKRIIKEEQTNSTIEPVHIQVKDGQYTSNWFLSKIDATHLKMSNNVKRIDDEGMTYHINQLRNHEFYNDVKSWLKGGKSPNGKTYNEVNG